jgi:putative transcriptional regulator
MALYHYTMCGLDNVWLENGFEIIETPYGQGVSIHDVEGLHVAIAKNIITKSKRLTGKEIKFLRKELNMSQSALSVALGVSENSVRGWEKSRTDISQPADRLLRLIYISKTDGDQKAMDLINMIIQVDEELNNMTLIEENDNWSAKEAA